MLIRSIEKGPNVPQLHLATHTHTHTHTQTSEGNGLAHPIIKLYSCLESYWDILLMLVISKYIMRYQLEI